MVLINLLFSHPKFSRFSSHGSLKVITSEEQQNIHERIITTQVYLFASNDNIWRQCALSVALMITHNRQCVCVCVRLKCAFTRTNPYHLRKEARRKKTETNIRQATKSTIEIFFHEIQAQRSAKVIIDHPPNKMIMLQGIHWNTESTAWPILSRHMSSDKKSDDDVYLPFHRIFPLYHSGTVFV